ncbi:MAG: serine/threonine-protein kinase, partial [Bdellovibrionales bacterium]|nr:serine/threonine-protein kinase [Bdellovibrionales bacterium]
MSKSEKPNDKQSSTDDQPVLALDSPSQLRISRFEVIKRIGKGGMGEVYLCRDPGANGVTTPYVALKTIFRDALKDAESISRFEAEARALEGLNHANIVHLVEWGKQQGGHADGMYYMAMEYIDGTTIHSLSRSHRLSFPDILDISIQLANGLSATHATGVIHRDIKPANVMVNKKNVAKLIDFGIAKPTVQEFGLDLGDGFTEDQDFKTKTGIVIGTANYLAPELLRSSSQNAASPLSDIYALGVLIWEMLNATTPFKASSFGETMHRILEENLAWPDAITDIAPHGFIRLVNRMLSKDPSKRPQSANKSPTNSSKSKRPPLGPPSSIVDRAWISDCDGRRPPKNNCS